MVEVQILKGSKVIYDGDAYDAKDKVEELFKDEYGFALFFETDDDEDEFYVWINADSMNEHLNDAEWSNVKKLGISSSEVPTTQAVQKALGVTFKTI